jgi:hypothetical protein
MEISLLGDVFVALIILLEFEMNGDAIGER